MFTFNFINMSSPLMILPSRIILDVLFWLSGFAGGGIRTSASDFGTSPSFNSGFTLKTPHVGHVFNSAVPASGK
jgi:hypothetical protein